MGGRVSLVLIIIFLVFGGIISFTIINNPETLERLDFVFDFVGFLIVLSSLILVRGRGRG